MNRNIFPRCVKVMDGGSLKRLRSCWLKKQHKTKQTDMRRRFNSQLRALRGGDGRWYDASVRRCLSDLDTKADEAFFLREIGENEVYLYEKKIDAVFELRAAYKDKEEVPKVKQITERKFERSPKPIDYDALKSYLRNKNIYNNKSEEGGRTKVMKVTKVYTKKECTGAGAGAAPGPLRLSDSDEEEE